jgi:hypothetical protein
MQPLEHLDCGCLTRPVRPEQTKASARANLQRDARYRVLFTVGFYQFRARDG